MSTPPDDLVGRGADMILPASAPRRVLACGAWLKNTAGLLQGSEWLMSPLHGDLGTPEACIALEASLQALRDAARGPIAAVAHDLHPDFHSTHLALQLAEALGVPALAVQHHHAHIAAVQAEHGVDGPVIGLALDGVGLGTDGTAWGGELLWVDRSMMRRLGHLPALALPGGDAAAREPWRMAAALLHALGRPELIVPRLAHAVGGTAAAMVATLLARDLRCPMTTSAGRWFDAVAGLLGVSVVQQQEAEAATALERLAAQHLAAHPGFDVPWTSLDLLPLMHELLSLDTHRSESQALGAAMFHVALAHGLVAAATEAAIAAGVATVALSGGCFFNRVLGERVADGLRARGLAVLRPQALSCGDAGLALGQAWAVAHLET